MWTYGGSAQRLADSHGIHSSEALDRQASTSLQHYNGNQKRYRTGNKKQRQGEWERQSFGMLCYLWVFVEWMEMGCKGDGEEEEKDKKVM